MIGLTVKIPITCETVFVDSEDDFYKFHLTKSTSVDEN